MTSCVVMWGARRRKRPASRVRTTADAPSRNSSFALRKLSSIQPPKKPVPPVTNRRLPRRSSHKPSVCSRTWSRSAAGSGRLLLPGIGSDVLGCHAMGDQLIAQNGDHRWRSAQIEDGVLEPTDLRPRTFNRQSAIRVLAHEARRQGRNSGRLTARELAIHKEAFSSCAIEQDHLPWVVRREGGEKRREGRDARPTSEENRIPHVV